MSALRSEMFARTAFIKVKPGVRLSLPDPLSKKVWRFFERKRIFGASSPTSSRWKKELSLSLWDQKECAGASGATTLLRADGLARVVLEILLV